ncbi:unnamed protein product [Echinostoma caproni]|uniref:Ribosomal protein L7/L12 n=1 Tax=Echinostoma caproni TaxID=27848 RepID=A0A183AX24_9TREM|nr:unnamed protein product [Echinostoma caproni]
MSGLQISKIFLRAASNLTAPLSQAKCLYPTRGLTSGKRFTSSQPKSKVEESELQPPSIPGSDAAKSYSAKITRIVDEISTLTLLEVADLTELLQKKLNIQTPTAFMPTMMPTAANSPPPDEAEEQQTSVKSSFTVKLMKFDASKKVPLIKEIKQIVPDMNLVQAKKFVEASSAPGNIKADVSKEEAEEIKKVLEAVGATVEID